MKKNSTIEFMRFIFCCIICLHHFRSYGKPDCFSGGYLGVDVFFVISGFLLMKHFYQSLDKEIPKPELEATHYIRNRFLRVFPHHLFSWCCMLFVDVLIVKNISFQQAATNGLWELMLLKSTGLGGDFSVNGISWYLSAMLLASYFVYWILCSTWKNNNNVNLFIFVIAPLIVFFILSWIRVTTGHLNVWTQDALVLTIGFWRGFAEISLGCIAYYVTSLIINREGIVVTPKMQLLATCFELFGWGLIIKHSYYGNNIKDFYIPFIVVLLLISSFTFNSILTRLLDNPLSMFLGRISFPMYLNQLIIQKILRIIWPDRPFYLASTIMFLLLFLFSLFSDWLVKYLTKVVQMRKKSFFILP